MAVIFLCVSAAKGKHGDEGIYGERNCDITVGFCSKQDSKRWLWEDSRQEVIRLATDITNSSSGKNIYNISQQRKKVQLDRQEGMEKTTLDGVYT